MPKTTVDINSELLDAAKRITGLRTTKEVVNAALEGVVRKQRLTDLAREFRASGIVTMSDEELDKMRANE